MHILPVLLSVSDGELLTKATMGRTFLSGKTGKMGRGKLWGNREFHPSPPPILPHLPHHCLVFSAYNTTFPQSPAFHLVHLFPLRFAPAPPPFPLFFRAPVVSR